MSMGNTEIGMRNYDFWLHWIPTYRCNLNCSYCFSNPIKNSSEISKIDAVAIARTLNDTKKVFRISFTGGGEPFLIPNIIDACVELTRNHFIGINTNLTSQKVKEFSERIDPAMVLYIQASLHIKELEKHRLLGKYVDNFQLCRDKGFNISAHVVGYPPLLIEVYKYTEYFQERGIFLEWDPFIGKFEGKKYPDSYSEKELMIVSQGNKNSGIYKQQGKLCNAGFNVGVVNPYGYISPCFNISRSIGRIYDKIKFNKKLIQCPFELCKCPMNFLDPYLYEKGKKESHSETVAPILLVKDITRDYIKEGLMKHLPNNIRTKIFNFAVKHGL